MKKSLHVCIWTPFVVVKKKRLMSEDYCSSHWHHDLCGFEDLGFTASSFAFSSFCEEEEEEKEERRKKKKKSWTLQ